MDLYILILYEGIGFSIIWIIILLISNMGNSNINNFMWGYRLSRFQSILLYRKVFNGSGLPDLVKYFLLFWEIQYDEESVRFNKA